MDISNLQVAEGAAELDIKHPVTAESTGITFGVVRRHSREGKRIAMAVFRETPKEEGESEQQYLERVGELITCDLVTWWKTDETDNCIKWGKERLEHSRENVRRILLDPGFYWMLEAVQNKVMSLDTFFGKPTKS